MKLLLTLTLLFNFAFATLDDDIKTFVQDFKSKKNEIRYIKKIKALPTNIQEKIIKRYKQTIKVINPKNIPEDKLTIKLQRSLDNNVYYIYKFYKEMYVAEKGKGNGKAEHIAKKHEKKVPELKGSKIIEKEKIEGEIADRRYKIRKYTNQLERNGQKEQAQKIRDEYNTLTEEIKKDEEVIKKDKEVIKKDKEVIKKLDEELRAWDLLLGNIQKISK